VEKVGLFEAAELAATDFNVIFIAVIADGSGGNLRFLGDCKRLGAFDLFVDTCLFESLGNFCIGHGNNILFQLLCCLLILHHFPIQNHPYARPHLII